MEITFNTEEVGEIVKGHIVGLMPNMADKEFAVSGGGYSDYKVRITEKREPEKEEQEE